MNYGVEQDRFAELHEALDSAGQLYERYLDVAGIGDVARFTSGESRPQPAPNAPLTLEIHTGF